MGQLPKRLITTVFHSGRVVSPADGFASDFVTSNLAAYGKPRLSVEQPRNGIRLNCCNTTVVKNVILSKMRTPVVQNPGDNVTLGG
jgi:hypothetical protein